LFGEQSVHIIRDQEHVVGYAGRTAKVIPSAADHVTGSVVNELKYARARFQEVGKVCGSVAFEQRGSARCDE
jgi:hypothetical protein